MHKAFHFDSPRQRYRCDAAIVWCFDNRFEVVLRRLVKRLGLSYYDPIRIAGGTKCLASPDHDRDREFVLEQIRISMRLHATETVILMLHSDCGAYGGTCALLAGTPLEAEHQPPKLHPAAPILQTKIPRLDVN